MREFGTVHHNGHAFTALGATTNGRSLTAYTRQDDRGNVSLTTWKGETLLVARSYIVQECRLPHDRTAAIAFRMTRGRWIIGYALDLSGGLFRGELHTLGNTYDACDEAKRIARAEAEYWMEIDAEEDATFQEELDAAEGA